MRIAQEFVCRRIGAIILREFTEMRLSVSLIGLLCVCIVAAAERSWLASVSDRIMSIFGDGLKDKGNTAMTEDQIQKTIEQSKTLLMSGNVEQSVDILLPVFKARPDHTDANALVGAIMLSVHRFELAEQFLFSAVNTSHWTNSRAVANLAQVFMQTDAVPLAMQTLRRGLEAVNNEDSTGALSLSFGDVAYFVGNYSQASEWYLLAALKRVNNIDIWIKASTIRYPVQGRNLKVAENVLVQALALNRENAEIVFNMGLAMHGSGRLPEAITFYQEALRMGHTDPEVVSTLATALHSNGQLAEALQQYAASEARAPSSNAVFLANYAMLLNTMDNKQEAIKTATRALALDSGDADALRAMRECTSTA